jgi:hypothetical protein
MIYEVHAVTLPNPFPFWVNVICMFLKYIF